MPKKHSPPSYRFHKARNCAVVTIGGQNHYLGPYGSPESHERYARLIAEHFGNNGCPPAAAPSYGLDITVNELVARYWTEHVEKYHTKNGKPTDRRAHIRLAMRPLCDLYGGTLAREFGPRRLKLVRDRMIESRLHERGRVARTYINDHVGIIKRMFRWAVAEELVSPQIHQALGSVESIHRGRDRRVRESKKVLPAPEKDVEAVLEVVSPQIGAMIRLQMRTGMRPDEVTIMRPCDVDRSGPVWHYVPESHKTEHLGIQKIILLGPKAQQVLTPWLDREPTAYCFDPREVVEAALARRRRSGKPVTKRRRQRRSRRVREHYDDESYCQAVQRACEKAGVQTWSPGQLRHSAATRIRRKYGLEAARLILGHQSMATAEIYAEKDMAEATRIVKEMG